MTKFIKIIVTSLFVMSTSEVLAGGLLTNTNQNASFLRQMSQNAIIDITGLYFNPAGTAFLSDGWHISLNSQSAFQHRNIDTTFPLYALNVNNRETTHSFEGVATAPVIPSFQVSYNHDKWSVNANFALAGGGGKCEFKDGLGSFEALYAGQIYSNVAKQLAEGYASQAIPQMMALGMSLEQAQAAVAIPAAQYAKENLSSTMQNVFQGYSLNPYMKGRQYYFALTLGGTYKITDYLAVFAGVRGVYATCNYYGYVQDVKYTVMGQTTNAKSDLTLNCDQTGFGITPIIGFDCKIDEHWNVAVKYELPTKMNLKNSSEMNEVAEANAQDPTSALSQFKNGAKVREDIPSLLTVGVQYSPIEAVRINAGMNAYFDQQAKKYGNKQELIDKNTLEVNAGVEYDINKMFTVSASWQNTNYGMSDAYMNDLSFNCSSNSIGCGMRINATNRCSIDLGYMHTFYQGRTVETQTAAGIKTDAYNRKNDVVGIGVNINLF